MFRIRGATVVAMFALAAAAAPASAQNKQTNQQGARPAPAPAPTPAPTPPPVVRAAPPPPPTFEIEVCNKSRYRAAVAWSYQREQERGSQRWFYEGWTVIEPGACAERRTANRHVYVFATKKDETNSRWEGAHNLCVWYPGPYNRTMMSGETCTGTLEPYYAIKIENEAVTYNLTD